MRHNAASDGRFHRSKTPITQDVLSLARERIRECFKLFDTCIISFSGGKDSTVVLNLALEAYAELGRKEPLTVFHLDEEAIPYETEQYVRRVAQDPRIRMFWFCLPVQHRNACSRRHPHWWPWAPESRELWVRPMPPEGITWEAVPDFPIEPPHNRRSWPDLNGLLCPAEKYGRVGMLMGIRAQESLIRLGAILKPTADTRPWIRGFEPDYRHDGNIAKCYPIYDWTTQDVWTAPGEFAWDYNRAYDIMDKAGITPHAQRCAPPYGEEPMQQLWQFAVCFPDIWDNMSRRVPGARTAARYSRTQLYGFGGRPEKPPGVGWEDFLMTFINRHPEAGRKHIAQRIKMWINTHFSTTFDPIAVLTPHPVTGVSWDFLLMLAMRGDEKERKAPRRGDLKTDEARATRVAKYQAEIDAMRATGELPPVS